MATMCSAVRNGLLLAPVLGLFLLGTGDLRAEIVPVGTEEAARLMGYVYADLDGDSVRDDFERPIRLVEILLRGTDENGQTVNRSTVTRYDGTYVFDDLLAGLYEIIEIQPYKYIEGKPNAPGTAGGKAKGSNRFVGISLEAGVEATGYNFGEWGLKPKYVSKRPYLSLVPEPSTLVMLMAGVGLLVLARRQAARAN
ncbi:MAG: PEP-CTERM sorting domain-containing protein [Pirellulales bacterium]|nr:PEP-CTERM sorting domain-containing protein [Pirellulales bacterium]